jgi:cationic peptide transport system substrate-binding protein
VTRNDSPASPAKVLRIGLISGVHNLDPSRAQDFVSLMAVSQIFERPYAAPDSGRPPVPILFRESLQPESADQTVFSAAVREEIRFSDGTPLSAPILCRSLERVSHFNSMARAEPRADRVVFDLRRPNANFELALAAPYCGIAHESGGQLLGTGPYLAAPGSTPERMRLVRNPNHRATPPIDELDFICFPPDADGRATALLQAFERGEVDFTNVLHREVISGMSGVRKQFAPANSTAILYFNTERPPLGDPEVRRAIAAAIDRVEVASLCYPTNPLAITATGLLPPMMSDWRDELRFDLAAAGSRLAARQLGDIPPLRMMVMFGARPYLAQPQAVAHYLAGQLGKLGLEVLIETTRDSEDYFRRVTRGDYDLALTGWIADTLDPGDFLESCLSAEAIPSPGQISFHANLARWHEPRVSELLQQMRTEPGGQSQQEILQLVADEMPLLPLVTGALAYVHSFGVRNFQPDPLGIPAFDKLDLRPL